MKLATLNPRMDFNVEAFLSKDVSGHQKLNHIHGIVTVRSSIVLIFVPPYLQIFQSREPLAHPGFHVDSSSVSSFPYGFQPSHGMIVGTSEVQYPENPLNSVIHRNTGIHLPQTDGFPGIPSQVIEKPSSWVVIAFALHYLKSYCEVINENLRLGPVLKCMWTEKRVPVLDDQAGIFQWTSFTCSVMLRWF